MYSNKSKNIKYSVENNLLNPGPSGCGSKTSPLLEYDYGWARCSSDSFFPCVSMAVMSRHEDLHYKDVCRPFA